MIKLFEAFAGYGSQSMALKRLGVPYEIIGISEIEENAIAAYNATHPGVKNYGDITLIDWSVVPDFNLFTYSFPCQDISNAGHQGGFKEGSGTRSSLLWECKRAIESKMPECLVMENVKNLVSQRFLPYFHKWETYLESLGYVNSVAILNSKNYGIPQHRERVFMVSRLNGPKYHFPRPFKLEKRLEDMLEPNVDTQYFLSNKVKQRLRITNSYKAIIDRNCIIRIGNYSRSGHNASSIVSPGGVSPTVMENHGTVTAVFAPNSRTDTTLCLNSKVNGKQPSLQDRIYDSKGISTAITTSYLPMIKITAEDDAPLYNGQNYQELEDFFYSRIINNLRKLTERECFRLMGVSDDDIDKIFEAVPNKSQRYILAGNSIVVDVLYYIFKEMFKK